MLIETEEQLDTVVNAVRDASIVVFDTEANGLYLRHDNKVIGLSVYLPESDTSAYLAWAHGESNVDRDYDKYRTWTNPKKLAYAYHNYFEYMQSDIVKQNKPIEWLEPLREVWTPDKLYIGHNIQFDLTALEVLNFPIPENIADTMSMLSVVNSDWRGNSKEGYYPVFTMPDGSEEKGNRQLKWQARLWNIESAASGIGSLEDAVNELAKEIQRYGGDRAVLETSKKYDPAQVFLWMLAPDKVAHYAEEDVRLTWKLYEKALKFSEKWDDAHVHDLYNDITLLVWDMQHHGFRLGVKEAQAQADAGQQEYDRLIGEIEKQTKGMVKSPNSPKQIVTYLNSIGINVKSSSKEALKGIDNAPVLELIQEARHINKLLGTYVNSWLDNHVNGIVHPELNVGGTGTGRLSSSSDKFGNFQNIPRKTAKGAINPKSLLFPPKGNIILDMDYKTLEMCVAAWVAETLIPSLPESTLAKIFGGNNKELGLREARRIKSNPTVLTDLIESGADMHAYTMRVSGIYDMLLTGRSEREYLEDNGYDVELITQEYAESQNKAITADLREEACKDYFHDKIARFRAKTTNFAAIYGAGAYGIKKAIGCDRQQAQTLIDGYHRAYPAVRPAMSAIQRLALQPRPLPGDPTSLGQYVIYPLPGLDLRRKFNWYPVRQETRTGGVYSPQDKAAWAAFNSVVQGTAGLLVLKSILLIKERFGFASFKLNKFNERVYNYDSGLLVPHLTVHDSFIPSLRPDDLYIVPEMVEIMVDYPVRPALNVDVSAAPVDGSWGDTQTVKDLDAWIESRGEVRT